MGSSHCGSATGCLDCTTALAAVQSQEERPGGEAECGLWIRNGGGGWAVVLVVRKAEKTKQRAWTDQRVRTLAILPKDLGSILSIHMAAYKHL